MRMQDALLKAGFVAPAAYFSTYLVGALLNPAFSPVRDAPSELGRVGEPNAWVFSLGLVVAGVAGIVAAGALFVRLRQAARGPWLLVATTLSFDLFCVSLVMAGLFPLPSDLHYGFGTSMAGLLTPLLAALVAWRAGLGRNTIVSLAVAFAGVAALAAHVVTGQKAGDLGVTFVAVAALVFASIAGLCRRAGQTGQVSSDRLSASPTR